MSATAMQLDHPSAVSAAELAARLGAITYDSIPAATIAAAKRLLLDTLSVSWAAADAAGVRAVREVALQDAGAARSTLWGSGERIPPDAAAFVNGTRAAALDYDSLHDASGVHADIVTLPAALAVAESVRADGRGFLAAYVAGNELTFRVARAGLDTAGWFRTSIYGVFGAAAAAGLLLGLRGERLGNALGIALAQASGTQQAHIERKLTKRLQSAFAARAGVAAARLAGQGITGPTDPLEGRFGLLALHDRGSLAGAFDDLGKAFLLAGTSVKKYPACACSHAAIEAALVLRARHALDADAMEAAEVVITPGMDRLVGGAFSPDGDAEVTAQFCAQYAVAAALLRGRFTVADIAPAAVRDPAILPVAARIAVRVDRAAQGRLAPAEVVVRTRDGRLLRQRIDYLPGSPQAPLTDAQVRGKAIDGLAYGADALAPETIARLIERIEHLDSVPDMASFFDGIVPPPSAIRTAR